MEDEAGMQILWRGPWRRMLSKGKETAQCTPQSVLKIVYNERLPVSMDGRECKRKRYGEGTDGAEELVDFDFCCGAASSGSHFHVCWRMEQSHQAPCFLMVK